MGCLVRIIAGVLLVGIGAAIAIFVPPFMEQATQDKINLPDVSEQSLKSARIGDLMVLSGKIGKTNPAGEKGIVVGGKFRRERVRDDSNSSTKYEYIWAEQDRYMPQTLKVWVPGTGNVAVSLDSADVSGASFEKSQGDEVNDLKWSGVRRGDPVTIPVELKTKSPPKFAQRIGYDMFAGNASTWRSREKQTAEGLSWIFYAIGGVFVLGGAVTFLSAPFKRKS